MGRAALRESLNRRSAQRSGARIPGRRSLNYIAAETLFRTDAPHRHRIGRTRTAAGNHRLAGRRIRPCRITDLSGIDRVRRAPLRGCGKRQGGSLIPSARYEEDVPPAVAARSIAIDNELFRTVGRRSDQFTGCRHRRMPAGYETAGRKARNRKRLFRKNISADADISRNFVTFVRNKNPNHYVFYR